MRLYELIPEAITPVGSTSNPVAQNGLPKTGTPTLAGQTPPAAQSTIPPAVGQAQAAPTLGNQAAPGQPPAMQQGMKDTMTDLDKIAAQIVGLKQKQQQMQQQMQKPTPTAA